MTDRPSGQRHDAMLVTHHASGASLLERAGEVLEVAEAENGLLLGICAGPPPSTEPDDPALWLTVDAPSGPIAAAVRTPPFNIVVSRAPVDALAALVDDLRARSVALPGVTGVAEAARGFTDQWAHARGMRSHIALRQGVYELTRVVRPSPHASGALRVAMPAEVDLVAEWMNTFNADAGLPARDLDWLRRLAAAYVASGTLFLWEDAGRPVSMAALQAPTRHGVRVSFVFTPRELRGRGYASASVAAVSAHALASGRRLCSLYTDLANPTSNAIYQRVGYRLVCESLMIGFDE